MTELKLIRNTFTLNSTIGDLFIDGVRECFILEDRDRGDNPKIHGATCIPYGRYEIAITYSNRFKRQLPLLMNVPNFEGIRIHSGNLSTQTEGCLLPGETKGVNFVGNSRNAFGKLFDKLEDASKKGKIFIEIVKDNL